LTLRKLSKWILTLNSHQQLEIKEREVSKYASLNRVLDEAGYYHLTSIEVDNKRYIIVYLPEEEHETKTKILVSRIHPTEEKIIDMTIDNMEQVTQISYIYMQLSHSIA